MTARYALIAQHPTLGKSTITATCDNDTDATLWGISRTLDRAITSRLWAEGAVTLKQGTRILHTMPAKVPTT